MNMISDKPREEADDDDMRPEYDLSNAKRVGRKYIDRLANGTTIVVTDEPPETDTSR
jgi:hypothetical protein